MKTVKNFLFIIFVTISGWSFGQVRIVNTATNTAAPNSSAFIDASSNSSNNSKTNVGKGLLYPRVDLTAFAVFSGTPTGIGTSYPTRFDGMVVYNTATGIAGIGSTTVNPGFYYYSNQTTNVNGGKWIRMNDGNITSTPNGSAFPTVPEPNEGDVFYRTDLQDLYFYNGSSWIGASINFSGSLTGDVSGTQGATVIGAGKVTNDMLAGSIASSKLVGSDITTIGTLTAGSVPYTLLSGSVPTWDQNTTGNAATATSATTAGTAANFSGSLAGDVSGTQGATVIGAGKVTNSMLAGSIASSKLVGTDIITIGTLTAGSVPYSLLSGTVPTWDQNTTGNAATATTATTAGTATNFSGSLTGDVSGTQGATVIGEGKVTNSMLAGSIASSKLVGSDITTIGTLTAGSVPYTLLSGTVPTWDQNTSGNAATATSATSFSGSLTGDVSGTQEATVIGAGKVTNSMLAGSIASSKLVGTDITTVGTLTTGSVPYTLLSGTVPTWNQNTTGNAATATAATSATTAVTANTATNLSGGLAGQIPYQTAEGTTAMLAAGTSGQVLTSNGAAAPTWTNMPAPLNVTTEQTGNYTALATDDIILYNANTSGRTLTLPTSSIPIGKKYYVSNIGVEAVAILPTPREETTLSIPTKQAVTMMYVGSGQYSMMSGY